MPILLTAIPAIIAAGSSAAAGVATAAGIAAVAGGAAAGSSAAAGVFLGLEAATWASISAVATLATAGGAAYGGSQQASQQRDAAKYNQRAADAQALDVQRRGSIAEGQASARKRAVGGAAEARQGSSGVVAGQGTGADVLSEIAEVGARDAATINANAQREAWGIRTQSQFDFAKADNSANATEAKSNATFIQGVASFSKEPWWKAWQNEERGGPGVPPINYTYGDV